MKPHHKFLLALLLASAVSCQKLIEPQPEGLLAADVYFSDGRGALAGVNGAYSTLLQGGAYKEALWRIGDITSDDTDGGDGQLEDFTYDENSGIVSNIWNTHYQGIYRCNYLIARIPQITFTVTDPVPAERLVGEAKFLRGLLYFNLVRIFGGVPLITQSITAPSEAAVPRSSAEAIYAQIEQDLLDAIAGLDPVTRYRAGGTGYELGRASRGAAQALLARVYLTRKDWARAAQYAQEVINSGHYSLAANYADNFTAGQGRENIDESVFEIQFSNASEAVAAYTTSYMTVPATGAITSQGYGNNYPTDNTNPPDTRAINGGGLVQAYEEGDLRKAVSISNYGGKVNRFLANKYFNTVDIFRRSSANYPVIRYADVLLMYAEAVNEGGGPTPQAYEAVNQVRRRAFGLPLNSPSDRDLPAGLDQAAFRERVYQERRVELAFEGHRWFDLVRTGRAVEVMLAQGRNNINQNKLLFPIPAGERVKNELLEQNVGYN
jgi:hypothetical protein